MPLATSPSPANIAQGAAVVSLSAWVTAGGSGTFTDVGYTDGPTGLKIDRENKIIEVEQLLGPVAAIPVKQGIKIKVNLVEALLENWRKAFAQSVALGGTTPNFVLALDEIAEIYLQVKIVTKPHRLAMGGTPPATGARTIIIWRCVVENTDELQFAKSSPQIMPVTFVAMEDPTVTASATLGRFGAITDTLIV